MQLRMLSCSMSRTEVYRWVGCNSDEMTVCLDTLVVVKVEPQARLMAKNKKGLNRVVKELVRKLKVESESVVFPSLILLSLTWVLVDILIAG